MKKIRGISGSNSFTEAEIKAMVMFFRHVEQNNSLIGPLVRKVQGKFLRMLNKMETGKYNHNQFNKKNV